MTKTLTEQWREGTLPDGHYYVQYDKCSPFIKDSYGMIELKKCIDSEKIKVLSAVPSHSEYQAWKDNCELTHLRLKGAHQKITQMEKRLEIATKALKLYADDGNWCNCLSWNGFLEDNEVVKDGQFGENGYEPAQKALKEMEGVK